MKKELKLPRISEGEDTGIVSDVYVKKGDHVEEEQSVVAIESDKATVDVPAEFEGKVAEVRIQKGDEISVGDTLVVLETNGTEEESQEPARGEKSAEDEGEDQQENKAESVKEKGAEDEEHGVEDEEKPERSDDGEDPDKPVRDVRDEEEDAEAKEARAEGQEEHDADETGEAEEKTEERRSKEKEVGAAPLARKLARELGIDIADLQGDDAEARVTREDVLNHARDIIDQQTTGQQRREPESEGFDLPDFSRWGDTERHPMSQIRRATSKKTALSWKFIPHVTQFDKADITALESFRKQADESSDEKITVTAILLKVCAEALIHYPNFNASLDIRQKEVVLKKYVNIGVAVDTDRGLLMPVVRHVDTKSIPEIAAELVDISEKARAGRLSRDEMEGGNFAISNQGGIGGEAFTPIIFPPHVAILGVSRAEKVPVYDGEELRPRTVLPICVSYDHRLIDGADAARFLRWICGVLEQPMKLLMQ